MSNAHLWERYGLVYAYSATGMKTSLDVHKRPKRAQTRQTLLVMANPDFGLVERSPAAKRPADRSAELAPVRGLYERTGGLGRLPHTQAEADAILAAFPEAVVRTDEEAQETLVKQTGGNYRYLHFATHAVFHDAAPLLSGVILARPPIGSTDDGILTVRELLGMSLTADMMVLSACETARGAKQRGEGIIGLTWAMFAAGVPTQIVSQWAVDDAATAQLMGRFYRGLKQGKSKEEALRAAALSLLRNGKHHHPFYWAPFLVMGDWR
jgi:CHAT domain-containing protein